MAYDYLISIGWDEAKAMHVCACILSHRHRSSNPPVCIEAKILFDADKLDVTGAIGVARTFLYLGTVGDPIYSMSVKREVLDGTGDEPPSYLHEYHHKLKNLYDGFHTKRGSELAAKRRYVAASFTDSLFEEILETYELGSEKLANTLTDN